MRLSIVTTLYLSAPYVAEFHRRVSDAARKITDDYEIVMVDDGSPDNSLAIAMGLVERDPRLRIVELSRNYGHHKAMITGLEHTGGDYVFLIDVDLEEPPELLQGFFEEMRASGCDVVYGYQSERKGSWFERNSGALAWRLINLFLAIQIPHNHSTVRLMTRAYAQALVQHKEQKTAIGGLWVITGFRQKGTEFVKASRGRGSYTFPHRLGALLDSVTSFSEIPLFVVFFVGLLILLMSLAVAAGLVILRIAGTVLEGWISVMISVWLLGGLAIFCIGVVGLYVSRIFIETKGRPYTIIRQMHQYVTRDERKS
jgi:putative glycosyltransferase